MNALLELGLMQINDKLTLLKEIAVVTYGDTWQLLVCAGMTSDFGTLQNTCACIILGRKRNACSKYLYFPSF